MMMTRRNLTRFFGIAVFLGMFSAPQVTAPAHADERLEASRQLIASLISEVKALAENENDPEVISREVNRFIDTYADYDRIARFVAGNAWRSASDDQKKRYKAVFRSVLNQQFSTYLKNILDVEYIEGDVIAKGDKHTVVEGSINDPSGKNTAGNLSWHLYTLVGQRPRIFDVEVENISLLITMRDEFAATISINGGDFEALITELGKIADALAAQSGG